MSPATHPKRRHKGTSSAEQREEAARSERVSRKAKILFWIVAVVFGGTSLFGLSSWYGERNKRQDLVKEFGEATNEYLSWGQKAFLDVAERGYNHKKKSETQVKWERELWPKFKSALEDVERTRPTKTVADALANLRCANTRFYYLYDALDEMQTLSKVVDRERLRRDCGPSHDWIALNRLGDEPDREKIIQDGRKHFDALQGKRNTAVNAVAVWAEISYFGYLTGLMRSLCHL